MQERLNEIDKLAQDAMRKLAACGVDTDEVFDVFAIVADIRWRVRHLADETRPPLVGNDLVDNAVA